MCFTPQIVTTPVVRLSPHSLSAFHVTRVDPGKPSYFSDMRVGFTSTINQPSTTSEVEVLLHTL